MIDHILIEISSDLDIERVFNILSHDFPDFQWRYGDSEMQGEYISGKNQDDVDVQYWMRHPNKKFTISFDGTSLDERARENLKNRAINDTIPKIGVISEIRSR